MKNISNKNKDFVFLKFKPEVWTKVDHTRILFIESNNWNTIFHFIEEEEKICHYSLLKVQSILPIGFERINRSTIVNVFYIENVNNLMTILILKNNIKLTIGAAYKQNLKKYLLDLNKKNN